MEKEFVTYLPSPLGTIGIKGTENFISSVYFVTEEETVTGMASETVLQCKRELEEYFDGKRRVFTVNTKPTGTAFQLQVWEQLKKYLTAPSAPTDLSPKG